MFNIALTYGESISALHCSAVTIIQIIMLTIGGFIRNRRPQDGRITPRMGRGMIINMISPNVALERTLICRNVRSQDRIIMFSESRLGCTKFILRTAVLSFDPFCGQCIATEAIVQVPTLREYYRDLDSIILAASDGESKSFAYKRLQYLDGKWNLYILLNERQELLDSKVHSSYAGVLNCSACLIEITTTSEK